LTFIFAVASYLVVVVASQLISPILWDHYALMLLLPVAWLLSRGAWWTVLIPIATSVPLVGISPPAAYPVAFWVTLIAVVVAGRSDQRALEETFARPSPPRSSSPAQRLAV
jgi:hypothetical protein